MPICSEGHTSITADYCDVCGAHIGAPAAQPGRPAAAATTECSACGAPVAGRFCETCGHDSALPAPATPAPAPGGTAAPVSWSALVTADREFYERVLARGGPDAVDFPTFFPERRIPLRRATALIGRHNRAQGVAPEIDLGLPPADRGVSGQHAVLRIRDTGVTVTDLGSTNGTSLNGSDELLTNGQEVPLAEGDRIHVGAWTTIAIVKDP
jgi:FHA domain-containing protein